MLVGLMLVLFGWSCERESVPEMHLSSTTQLRNDLVSEDCTGECRCFLRLTGTQNAPSGELDLWGFADYTLPNEGLLDISGLGNFYTLPSAPGLRPFPTPYIELDCPSSGEHTFLLSTLTPLPNTSSFTVYAEVICYESGIGGELTPVKEYPFLSFTWSSGTLTSSGTGTSISSEFTVEFDCLGPVGPNG